MVHTWSESPLVEHLQLVEDAERGAAGVIAIDTTVLGPAIGGCRFLPYGSRQMMAADAMRLARGMSYRNALAGLPFGGGMAVLQRPVGAFDRRAIFQALAESVEVLGGQFVASADVGTTQVDMEYLASHTLHVAGLGARSGKAGGDPFPWTALGVFKSMQAASRIVLGSDVRGLKVAVQGVGNVGDALCHLLADAGARLVVADVDGERAAAVARRYGAALMPADDIVAADADILAPCAIGVVLDKAGIPTLKAGLVCGAADNQLATEADGEALRARGIGYVPDFVANAGGIVNVAAGYMGESVSDVQRRIDRIADRVAQVLQRATREGRPEQRIADQMAQAAIFAGRRIAA